MIISNFQLSKIDIKNILSLMKLSTNLITSLLLYWWNNEGKLELQDNIQQLRRESEECIRIYHTYKITSLFGTTIKNVWVSEIFFYLSNIYLRHQLNHLYYLQQMKKVKF